MMLKGLLISNPSSVVTRRGGGVAVIYKSDLNIQLIVSDEERYASFESMICLIKMDTHHIKVSFVYGHHHQE